MGLSIIVAIGIHNVIGMNNNLPWHYSEDLKYFKKVTMNHPVFMGYNTYLSIFNRLGHALPNRKNYVLTYLDELEGGGIPVKSIEDVKNKEDGEVFVIGGRMIYEMMLPLSDTLYITHVKKEYEGNVFFPEINYDEFEKVSSVESGDLEFAVYKRKNKA